MKTTEVSFEEFSAIDFEDCATYYVRNAMGYLYLHTKSRKDAQAFVDELYGKGHYKVRASKNIQPTEPKNLGHKISARA